MIPIAAINAFILTLCVCQKEYTTPLQDLQSPRVKLSILDSLKQILVLFTLIVI